jgi:hypothetical protein
MTADGQFNGSPSDSQQETCQKLIGLEADLYLENLAGQSAWKRCRDAMQESKDFGNYLGDIIREQQKGKKRAHSRLRQLLMPPGGNDTDEDSDGDEDPGKDFHFH